MQSWLIRWCLLVFAAAPVCVRISSASQPQQANRPAQSSPQQWVTLPVWSRPAQQPVSLLPAIPDGRSILIAKVEEKFASGEQNFKAGHLDAARRDFNDAVDWMLESGYDPNGDPKLSELFTAWWIRFIHTSCRRSAPAMDFRRRPRFLRRLTKSRR